MATPTKPRLVTLDQVPQKKAATPAERAAAYRARKKAEAKPPASDEILIPPDFVEPVPVPVHTGISSSIEPTVTSRARPPAASVVLAMAAFGLAGVGVTMNGWFARSLGSTETAGYLFLAIGVAADLAALAVPSVAARAWQARQRATAAAGWLIWLVTFAFAVTAGIGFASVNIADVTLVRAARVTPAVTAAQSALNDAMAARDRECGHGVGPFCRQREASVVDRRQALDAAMQTVAGTADPQTTAAVKLVSWASLGAIRPTADDFGMLRLALLSLLPQIGGVLLMIARGSK